MENVKIVEVIRKSEEILINFAKELENNLEIKAININGVESLALKAVEASWYEVEQSWSSVYCKFKGSK